MASKPPKTKGRIRQRLTRRKKQEEAVPYVGELGEELDESLREGPRRGFYVLPNLLTTASLILGFYSLSMSFGAFIYPKAGVDYFLRAAWSIVAALIFDGLDGRVARLTRTTSSFGMHYDSLVDLISFGVAPAVLIYNFALRWGPKPGLGWAVAMLFVICGALRLARFNITTEALPRDVFQGLAIPAASGVIVTTVLFFHNMEFLTEAGTSPTFWPLLVVTILLALLMVSKFHYPSFKNVNIHKRRPFSTLVLIIILLIVIFEEPEKTLFLAAIAYALSAPVQWVFRRVRNKPPAAAVPTSDPHTAAKPAEESE